MRKIIKVLFFSLFTVYCYAVEISNTPQIIQQINSKNGATDGIINDLITDKYGRLWLASSSGVFYYNGKQATQLTFGEETGTINFYSLALSQNSLLIGSNQGLFRVALHNLRIEKLDKTSELVISHIVQQANKLWLGTTDKGAFIYDLVTDALEPVILPHGIYSKTISDILKVDDEVWISVLTTEDISGGLVQFINNSNNTFFDNSNIAITALEKRKNELLIATSNKGIISLNLDNHAITEGQFIESTNLTIQDISIDNNDCVWAATLGQSVKWCGNNKQTITASQSFISNLPAKDLYRSYFDMNNNIMWLAGYTGGASGVYLAKEPSVQFHLADNTSTSPSSNEIFAITSDKNGDLWLGHNGYGIDHFKANGNKKHYLLADDGSRANHILKIYLHRNGSVFAGTFGGGIWIKRSNEEVFQKFTPDDNTLNRLVVTDIFADGDNIWVSTIRDLYLFSSSGSVLKHLPRSQLTEPGLMFEIEDINSEFLLLATNKGLVKVNKHSLQTLQGAEINNAHPGCNKSILDLTKDTLGNVWFLSDALCKFDISTMQIKLVDNSTHVNNGAYALTFSNTNKLFMFGGKLTILDNNSSSFIQLNNGNGLFFEGDIPSFGAIAELNDHIFFATNKGLASLPNNLERIEDLPSNHLFISKVVKMNSPLSSLSTLDSPLSIQLKSDERIISVDIEQVEYFNRKHSFSLNVPSQLAQPQILPNTENIALPTGQEGVHEIEIQSTAHYQPEKSQKVTIKLNVMPPWWRSNFAYFCYFVFFIAVIFIALTIRSKALKKRNELLKQQVRSKTQELNHALKAKDILFENVSHELKTPLTLILGRSALLQKDKKLPTDVLEEIDKIEGDAEKLYELVNQLLHFAEVKHNNNQKQPTDIFQETQNIVSSFKVLATNAEKPLIFTGSDQQLWLNLRQGAWSSIVSNLLSNAIKYGLENTPINISLTCKNDNIEFIVSNQGHKIEECKIKKLFNRFEQSNFLNPGQGLGLAIVKEIVVNHQGNIEIKSSELLTQVVVTIPIDVNRYNQSCLKSNLDTTQIIKSDSTDNKSTLLIVEDNDELREFMLSALGEQFVIHAVENGKSALEWLDRHTLPDLILSDVMMPELDGFTLCETLKKDIIYQHIPIFLLTAKSDLNSVQQGLSIAADDYIAKPFNLDVLITKITNQLNTRDALRKVILNQIVHDSSIPKVINEPQKNCILKEINSVLLKHFSNSEIKAGDIASALHLTEKTLNRKLQAQIGKSISELLREFRLSQAQKLLSQGQKPKEVCFKTGFNSLSYFGQCYKQRFGVTPNQASNHTQNTN